MSAFLSRRPNLDPEPWLGVGRIGNGKRRAEYALGYEHRPRPEFEPTRDPAPWAMLQVEPIYGTSPEIVMRDATAESMSPDENRDEWIEWRPRREQYDTPVNRVLADIRAIVAHYNPPNRLGIYWGWLHDPEVDEADTPDEIDHARRVLTRLANMTKED